MATSKIIYLYLHTIGYYYYSLSYRALNVISNYSFKYDIEGMQPSMCGYRP